MGISPDFIITNADDFYSYFMQIYDFENDDSGIHTKYKLNEKVGEGYMEQIRFKNGLEFCIGDFVCNRNITLNYHMKNAPFEVHYMLGGSVYHSEESLGQMNLSAGCMSVFFREVMKGKMTYVANRRIVFITIMLSDNLLLELLKDSNDHWDLAYFRKLNHIKELAKPHYPTADLKMVFRQILTCPFSNLAKLIALQGKAMEAMAYVFDESFYDQKNIQKRKVSLDRHAVICIGKAKEILEQRLGSSVTIKDLSKEVGINEYKLKVGFKEFYGDTIHGYQKRCRVIKAYELLKYEDYSVTQAAAQVGYTNISYFAKCFKEYYGENPKHFRFRM